VAQNNAQRSLPYDHAAVQARYVNQFPVSAAGSAGVPATKFYAHAQIMVYGVTFITVVPGTSTYTVSGTATNPATQISALYFSNTNTTGTAVSTGTNTVGPFTLGGTNSSGTATNYFVQGTQGGIAGGFQGPYALNTLGGTNTQLVWGTNTYVTTNLGTAVGQTQVGYPGGGGAGIGGLPMNPGDSLNFVNGTDASATWIAIVQWGYQPVNGAIVA
jgi:hypothetical protein